MYMYMNLFANINLLMHVDVYNQCVFNLQSLRLNVNVDELMHLVMTIHIQHAMSVSVAAG